MSILLILFIVACVGIFLGVLFSTPRILLRPQLKERLWQLRDEIYDLRRDGTFPYENEDVGTLILRVEAAIYVADDLTPARMIAAMWCSRGMPEAEKERLKSLNKPSLAGLDSSQTEMYKTLNRRLAVLVSSLPLLGTWSGLVLVVVLVPFLALGLIITIFSTRAQNKGRVILTEQRNWIEGIAYELSQEPRAHRRTVIGA